MPGRRRVARPPGSPGGHQLVDELLPGNNFGVETAVAGRDDHGDAGAEDRADQGCYRPAVVCGEPDDRDDGRDADRQGAAAHPEQVQIHEEQHERQIHGFGTHTQTGQPRHREGGGPPVPLRFSDWM